MATVKGDVHDIGKNIVGVVLQCNNYEVVDLGVMVPAAKILETARREKADIIGLSGLITPSLDEMCHVAAEMERQGFDVPLLIGGATTSRDAHGGEDPSELPARADGLCQRREPRRRRRRQPDVGAGASRNTSPTSATEYANIAAAHARAEENKQRLSLAAARANAPSSTGRITRRRSRASSARACSRTIRSPSWSPYIDWTPFFQTWELTGKFPAILDDAKFGEAARSLYRGRAGDAADRSSTRSWLGAARGGRLLAGQCRRRRYPRLRRRARARSRSRCCTRCASSSPAARAAPMSRLPISSRRASGLADYIGGFVVTAGIGEDEIAERFKHANDDYSAIMVKALADRLAEAFAERLHQRVRKEFWGYAPDEALEQRRADRARNTAASARRPAIRRSPITPRRRRCSRCSTPRSRIGVKLTESFAMWPGASVCGLYFSHPDSHYFGVGKIERDQVEDYARRKGWTVAEAETWLAPILNYDPLSAARVAAE